MTYGVTGGEHPPIYEDLLRERGDVVAEAQKAAEHTRHRAAELLGGQHAAQHHAPEGPHAASQHHAAAQHHAPSQHHAASRA
ncbi:hypothetical protein [Streptomyces sp. NPDC003487]